MERSNLVSLSIAKNSSGRTVWMRARTLTDACICLCARPWAKRKEMKKKQIENPTTSNKY
eukprot:6739656-Pyramimonas_sp.AAC.2